MNEKKFYFIMYCVWLLAFMAVWFCLGRISLHYNGTGADSIGRQLEQAQQLASAITDRVGQAERTTDEAYQTARRIESIVSESGDAIKDSQRILEGVRKRGKVETVKN